MDRAVAWRVYFPLAWISGTLGLVFGVVAQYATLGYCRRKQVLPQFMTTALVPGIRLSRAYPMLDMITAANNQLKTLQAIHQIKLWQIEAVQRLVRSKLAADTNISHAAQSQLLKRARRELDRIVAEGERQIQVQQSTPTPPPIADEPLRFADDEAGS